MKKPFFANIWHSAPADPRDPDDVICLPEGDDKDTQFVEYLEDKVKRSYPMAYKTTVFTMW